MAKAHISPNRTTDKTIRAIDRKREKERKRMFRAVKEYADDFAVKLTQRLIDHKIIEVDAVQAIQDTFRDQLQLLERLDEYDITLKVAPVRTIAQDPNIVSLYFTQYIIEDLIKNPAVFDVYGDDLDIYRAVDSIFRVLRAS
ncbi:hypothetical protein [Desulfotalea psychrophila]|uniref:Uncharacterized protein n=1 Tax=Desulfotalea psychrophila (strain LSv54 / DSM 12343) TaxID=177439 RepID=Q6AJ86_DESPS|nr:hypothetical protein [Desulfotalea psychrophila]CAG37594.1 unknown protein [Desulfotalea psychrophila LSv54]